MLRIKVDVLQFRLYKNSLKNPTYEVAENKHNHIFSQYSKDEREVVVMWQQDKKLIISSCKEVK